jgi:hypothetical protein
MQACRKLTEDRLQLSGDKRDQFLKHQSDWEALRTTITSLESEIANIDNTLTPRLTEELTGRTEKYLDFFDVLREEKQALESLYAPLHKALQEGSAIDKRLTFVARIGADIIAHARRGLEIVDRSRKGNYRGEESLLENAFKEFCGAIEQADFDRQAIKQAIDSLRKTFTELGGKPHRIADQTRKDRTEQEFDNWFYSTEQFFVTYSIRFDDKSLELLSPGQKGIVLLLLYLDIEREDNRPLVIDQPEENLDNLSVYEHLIEYFRKRKKTRQILIITHNPNLVVNTDSEQVVVANFDGRRTPKIDYAAGPLEDTSSNADDPGIREHVCKILEGGEEAFRRREERYSFAWS